MWVAGDAEFGEWGAGGSFDADDMPDVPVELPPHLAVRDAMWRPDMEPFAVVVGELAESPAGDSEDIRRTLSALVEDDELATVVPDDGEPYTVIYDYRRGRWVPTVTGTSPGQALASAVDSASSNVSGLSDVELGEVAAGCQRLMSWARSVQAAAITELSERPVMAPRPSGAAYASVSARACTALELTEPLRLTTAQAEALVAESVQLVDDFASTHAALTAGVLDERRARVIVSELGRQDHDVARLVEAAVVDKAAEMNARQLRRRITSLIHELTPVAAEERRRQAAEARHVRVSPTEDGMAWLEALLPAENAMAMQAVLEAGQKTLKRHDAETGDARARTADQRRADVLAELGWNALSVGRISPPPQGSPVDTPTGIDLSSAHGRPVSVHVTVPLSTLIGLDDHPGELAGYGPVPADVARHLSTAGVWQWVGTHDVTGAALTHGRSRYTPTRDLTDHVILRDRTCRAPGCDAPPDRCDLDHTIHFPTGGTDASNLGLFCRHHHLLKHHTRWRVDQPNPGVFVWTSPTNRTTTITTRTAAESRTDTGPHTDPSRDRSRPGSPPAAPGDDPPGPPVDSLSQ